jgi:uncharacterized phage protein gp47/JayE
MPYNRPAITELITRTRNDVVSRLPNADVLRRNNADVFARVLAGVAHGIYGYIDWLSKQLIYDTADGEILERWASIWGVSRLSASIATGQITLTGTNRATLSSGSQLAAYDGTLYELLADATIASGTATATIEAVLPGLSGNRTSGETLTLQNALPGINATAIAGALTGGADVENDESLRNRLLKRIKQPPQGGSKSDYETWALSVPGVTRVWVYPTELGAGTVVIRFMMDDTYSDGIPLSGDVATVLATIDPLRPVTANVTVSAPIAVPLDITISGLLPSTLAVRNAVTQELFQLIQREARPGGILLLSHINEAISIATGEVDHVLATPSANVSNAAGYITTLGSITWT